LPEPELGPVGNPTEKSQTIQGEIFENIGILIKENH